MNSVSRTSRLGVAYSLAASALFAVMYYYATLLEPMNGEQIFGWRMALTMPFAGVLLAVSGQWGQVGGLLRRLRTEPILWVGLPVSAALLGVQLWLFMWAPVNGHALDVSLGYFLLPLTLVATSRLVFREPISRLQLLACAIATVGVVWEVVLSPTLSWPTFVVCLAYPVYYMRRRYLRTNSQGGAFVDMVLIAPVALWFALRVPGALALDVKAIGLVIGLGVLSAAALGFMISSSQKLSLALFGLLSYVEPILLVFVAMLLGERIGGTKWVTYGAIWLAVGLLAWEGYRALRREARTAMG